MKFSIKKRIAISKTAVVAILMCLVCMFVFCMSTALNTKQAHLSAVERHIVLTNEIDADSVLSKYDDATFTIDGTTGVFDGYQNLDPSLFNEIDNIGVDSLTDEENKTADCRVHYTYTYDVETNIVTIRAEMKNEYGEIEIDDLQGIAFTDENGEFDAIVTLDDGETILLSDLVDNSVIDNVGWLSKLFKVVAAVVVGAVVAAVATTVGVGAIAFVGTTVATYCAANYFEVQKAKANCEHNKKLEQPNDFIDNQSDTKYRDWRYGVWTLNENGCGVIAIYNAMRKLGKTQQLYDIIYELETNSGMIAFGKFGTDPWHFTKYFKNHGVSYKVYNNSTSFENAINNMANSQCAVMCYKNDKNNIGAGYHNVAFFKESNQFKVFNGVASECNNLYDIMHSRAYDGKLIVGLIVG